MKKIITNLWFDSQAEEAANFCVSIFPNAKVKRVTPYPKAAEEVSGKKAGSIMTVEFEINGQEFIALNGGPIFKLNESVSFIIPCKDQEEIDYYWEKLSAVPASEQCGWCKDKFGVSWQVVPEDIDMLLAPKDESKREKMMEVFLKMHKIDIAALEKARE